MKKRKPKRRIRKSLVILFCAVLLVTLSICFLPGMIASSQLKKLGYDKATIKNIRKDGLEKDIISHQYYSDYLVQVINDGTLQKEYMYLYTVLDPERTLTADDFLLYNRLVDKGYETDQLVNLYQNLSFREIAPLLVFDYQWDEGVYIQDVISNRENNTDSAFHLSGSYITYYQTSEDASTSSKDEILVNQSNLLSKDYVPDDLTDVSTEHAVEGIQLKKEAAGAFTKLSAASVEAEHSLFASTGYIDYATQESAYTYYVNHVGSDSADYYTERAGASEHQTGLAVDFSLTYENDADLVNTEAYSWLQQNCADYGFILRYPEKFSDIIGRNEPDHLRYIGKDLAQKVNASGLSYDEYYLLYLAGWNSSKLIPNNTILSNTQYQGTD